MSERSKTNKKKRKNKLNFENLGGGGNRSSFLLVAADIAWRGVGVGTRTTPKPRRKPGKAFSMIGFDPSFLASCPSRVHITR